MRIWKGRAWKENQLMGTSASKIHFIASKIFANDVTFQITSVKWGGIESVRPSIKKGVVNKYKYWRKGTISRRKEAVNCYINFYEFNFSISVKTQRANQKNPTMCTHKEEEKLFKQCSWFSWSSCWDPALEWVCFHMLLTCLGWREGGQPRIYGLHLFLLSLTFLRDCPG